MIFMTIPPLLLRHHVPVLTYLLHNLSYFFLVCNSSVNFLVYCFVGKEFKQRMLKMFHK